MDDLARVQDLDAESIRDRGWLAGLEQGGAARRTAVSEIYTAFGGRIRRYFMSRGLSAERADDLLHETFVRMIEHAGRLKPDTRFAGWIWRVAHNQMLDLLRRENRLQALDELEDPPFDESITTPLESLAQNQLADCVRRQYAQFASQHPQRAQVLQWAVSDQLSMTEIADILGRNAGATREFVSQCRKKLRGYLDICRHMLD